VPSDVRTATTGSALIARGAPADRGRLARRGHTRKGRI